MIGRPWKSRLAHVEDFDTYWGKVSDLPDFSKAKPVACNYPSDHQPRPLRKRRSAATVA